MLQNKAGKALVLTSRSAVYLDLARNRIRWAFPLAALVGVGSTGPFLALRAWLGFLSDPVCLGRAPQIWCEREVLLPHALPLQSFNSLVSP